MTASIVTVDGHGPLKVSDEITLTPQQHAACVKFLDSSAKLDDVAKATGYANSSSLCRFLRSEEGQAGLRAIMSAMLAQAAGIGLRTMIELATDKKTPAVVKQKAAQDLMDRGLGVAGQSPPAKGAGAAGLSININLTRKGDEAGAIDITPEEGG